MLFFLTIEYISPKLLHCKWLCRQWKLPGFSTLSYWPTEKSVCEHQKDLDFSKFLTCSEVGNPWGHFCTIDFNKLDRHQGNWPRMRLVRRRKVYTLNVCKPHYYEYFSECSEIIVNIFHRRHEDCQWQFSQITHIILQFKHQHATWSWRTCS